jgi:very-short-patch-repair endonuclease
MDKLKQNARLLRNNMTSAERKIWSILRKRQFYGYRFLRQYTIGNYIVDFICRELQLIIEVDGGYHSEPRQQESDLQRENYLHEKGYRVLRFNNEEILFDLEKVINIIKQNL